MVAIEGLAAQTIAEKELRACSRAPTRANREPHPGVGVRVHAHDAN